MDSNVVITDLSSKIIKTITTDLSVVNVADLSDGIYFIQLITEERTITKKIVKQ
ncbi:MAG: T9SS type A sorting domain-containing protein [Flavobacteriales bacterium]